MNRRRFLRAAVIGTGALCPSCAIVRPAIPTSDSRTPANPLARSFDAEITGFMAARRIPGGSLAVVKDRRLVYAQGYGWADRERRIPATPRSLFRIASVSKPVTALAILKLAEDRRLDLDAPAFAMLGLRPGTDTGPAALPGVRSRSGVASDPRLWKITVRQLLQHTGGWDRDKSLDPMFQSREIAKAMGTTAPADAVTILGYMLGQPLDFDPGTRYAYSNFGYSVLGRIVERVTGESYADYVRARILAPCGIHRMQLGASLSEHQAPGEVRYYTRRGKPAVPVFPIREKTVPWPYGGFCLEAMDAHGGWIASAVDLARLAAALADPRACPILKPESLATMADAPPPPVWRDKGGVLEQAYFGCGWMIRRLSGTGRVNAWHTGSLPGTATLLVRRGDGLSWAVLFNQRSDDKRLPDLAIDPALHRAAAAVPTADWPAEDLFQSF